VPTLELEHQLLASGATLVAGVDEVGRGALAGPVAVGITVVDRNTGTPPNKLNDSKLIARSVREALLEPINAWCVAHAVGSASPREIDSVGITGGLRLAFMRAYEQLAVKPTSVILDGKHNWIGKADLVVPELPDLVVTTQVKADTSCASVAAASVIAKVWRDNVMFDLAQQHPQYGWQSNVGYGAEIHMDAIRTHGATPHHRLSWNLPLG
jgi:ribonuclease HII